MLYEVITPSAGQLSDHLPGQAVVQKKPGIPIVGQIDQEAAAPLADLDLLLPLPQLLVLAAPLLLLPYLVHHV